MARYLWSTNLLRASIAVCSLTLAGCLGSLLPKAPERAVFGLAAPEPMSVTRALPAALWVDTPRALVPLDGTDVVVIRADGEVQTMAGVRWSAPLPMLLQDLIARQIELAGAAPSVAQSAQSYRIPLRLIGDLRAFEAHVDGATMNVQAELTVHLVCTQSASIIASSPPIRTGMTKVANTSAAASAALRASASILARDVTLWLSTVDSSTCPLE